MTPILTGLDRLLCDGIALPGSGRVAVLCNATTVSSAWVPTVDALLRVPGLRLERIFSPQHGFGAEKQDNMVASPDGAHPRHGIPILSLYGDRRSPAPEAFDGIDAVVVDLPDVGTRVYTFPNTALLTIQAAARKGVPVVLLDRPNPIGGAVEGPVLAEGFRSFVGMVDVPLRHGLTIGELCLYGSWKAGVLSAEEATRIAGDAPGGSGTAGDPSGPLRIVLLEGWHRSLYLDEMNLPWTAPSPNMPTLETAAVYPGQVILEGSNLSEGRGTTQPFELFGAPYVDPGRVLEALQDLGAAELPDGVEPGIARGRTGSALDGALLREVSFEPMFQKYAGKIVRGFQLHVTDRSRFRPVLAATTILWAIRRCHRERFEWKPPPYEYERDRLPIDLIYGTDHVRLGLEAGAEPEEIAGEWEEEVSAYEERVRAFQLYGD